MKSNIRPILSKLNFYLRHNPFIERNRDSKIYIPSGFKTVILISADFEMAWASRYSKKNKEDALKIALIKANRERININMILEICDHYQIPLTWATVGHLFLRKCKKENGIIHKEIPKVRKYYGTYWDFMGEDWFEFDPCSNYREAPEWYAPDIISQIINSKVKHEIACHTFSHIDCRDNICPPELMKAELQLCKSLASQWGIDLKSFVHPGHTIGNLDILVQEGFNNFRTDYRNVLGYPIKHENGLWEFEQTAELVYRKEWSVDYHIYRYITIIKRAIESNTVCVFWFHPSFDTVVVEKILPEVFRFLKENEDKIWVTTHGNYVEWLENTKKY